MVISPKETDKNEAAILRARPIARTRTPIPNKEGFNWLICKIRELVFVLCDIKHLLKK